MIKLCLNITKSEAKNMWDDILKFLTIVIIIHLLLYSVDDQGELFDENTLKKFLYLTIGVIIYHLIIKKIITDKLFTQTSKKNNTTVKPEYIKNNIKKKSNIKKNNNKSKKIIKKVKFNN